MIARNCYVLRADEDAGKLRKDFFLARFSLDINLGWEKSDWRATVVDYDRAVFVWLGVEYIVIATC